MHDDHPRHQLTRRTFIGAAAAGALSAASLAQQQRAQRPAAAKRPVAIASGNGLGVVERAFERMTQQNPLDPLSAAVSGVRILENDPDDLTVGYGGLPNADGVVQLDASVMDGRSHRAGAVGALENIRHPSIVALEIARRTDHVMLVGEGAKRFALGLGFEEEDLLTPKSRRAWL